MFFEDRKLRAKQEAEEVKKAKEAKTKKKSKLRKRMDEKGQKYREMNPGYIKDIKRIFFGEK